MTNCFCFRRIRLPGALALLGLIDPLVPASTQAGALYAIDPRTGHIEFTVSHLGLFHSHGEFTRFDSRLTIDSQHPERTAISVVIHIASLAMAWENAADLLRSAAFFDAAHYPDARFTSTAVAPVSATHYIVKGNLEVRGVTRPIELDADLVGRHLDPQTDTEVGDFVVQGHLQRSAFGMSADSDFISDRVDLRISAHIQIVAPSG
jgi:polyisoprenoid-binding protein YceI